MTSSRVVPEMTMLHDAVHGPVMLDGWQGSLDGLLVLLARSPEFARLRRIKQLGLASYAFPAADHSRFAHALGTTHVMKRLVAQVEPMLGSIDARDVLMAFPGLENGIGSAGELPQALANHLLVAALVQDVGELPYAHATWRLLQAGPDVKDHIARVTGSESAIGGAKEYFTATFVSMSDALAARDDIDVPFLLFLLFGEDARAATDPAPAEVAALRHLLDGVVDADRLDYVYRDAHHTVGHVGGPQAVVDSLAYVDQDGPVFREPGPVLDFVTTRTSVWSRVYFEAQNRFRITLLRVILRGVRGHRTAQDAFFDGDGDGRLGVDEWLRVDDPFVQAGLERLAESGAVKREWRETGDGRAIWRALELYLEASAAYEAEWLPPPEQSPANGAAVDLPPDLFFDTCADYRHHRLYDRGSIRVDGHRFRRLDPPIPLEDCAGPLDTALQVTWFPLAVRDSVLLFLPEARDRADWAAFEQSLASGELYAQLMRMDEEQRLPMPDTREEAGFTGPAVFVSWAFDDREVVERVTAALRDKRQRYFLLDSALQGTGVTAADNSVRAVQEADAVLVVLSGNFKQRLSRDLDGNLSKEVRAICARHAEGGVPVTFVSADDRDVVERAFPWSDLGLSDAPLVEPIRQAEEAVVRSCVDRALSQIAEALE